METGRLASTRSNAMSPPPGSRHRRMPAASLRTCACPASACAGSNLCCASFSPGYSWDVRALGDVWRLFRSEIIAEPYYEPIRLRGYTELEADGEELQRFVVRRVRSRLRSARQPRIGAVWTAPPTICALGDYGSEVRFRWWQEPPSHWRSVGEIAGEMIARFMKLPEKAG